MTTTTASSTLMQVNLQSIITLDDAGIQAGFLAMRECDKSHIDHLVASELRDVPPVTIAARNGAYVLVDGYHRVEAARQLKRTAIAANVVTYPSDEAIVDAAFSANLRHGLPANDEQRMWYALWLHEHGVKQADIAIKMGMSQGHISRLLKKAERVLSEDDNDSEQASYQTAMIDYAKRLTNALQAFFQHEQAVLSASDSKRSESVRARALAKHLDASPKSIAMVQSLARTLQQTSELLQQKTKSKH